MALPCGRAGGEKDLFEAFRSFSRSIAVPGGHGLAATIRSAPPSQYVYPVAYGGPVFGQRGCRRALPRSGRESGEHGSRGLWRMQWLWPVGPREGGYSCTQSMPQGTTACRIGTGPQRTGSLRSLLCARMAAAKKSLCPVWGHRQEKQAEGKVLSHRQQRCDRMAAAGRARCDAGSYGHRQQRCDRMAAAGRAR